MKKLRSETHIPESTLLTKFKYPSQMAKKATSLTPSELLAPIAPNSHKYSRGTVGIWAGSSRFPGAAVLTTGGARRGGAGYINFFDQQNLSTELVLRAYPDVVPIRSIDSDRIDSDRIDAWVVGCGAPKIKRLPQSRYLVLDGSALSRARESHAAFTVMTPHEGEALALGFALDERIDNAGAIAAEFNAICVLKGPGTIIASPEGTYLIDEIGGSELATAGTGDILAGLIGSMLASWQPTNLDEAMEVVSYAVTAHSLAGVAAAKKCNPVVATDLLEQLPKVLAE